MNINKETIKLLEDIEDVYRNAENAHKEMIRDYKKEQSILGEQKAEILIKTFEEKSLNDIKTEILINGNYSLEIRIDNDIFYVKDNLKYRFKTDVVYLFDTGEEIIYIDIDGFLTEEFMKLLQEVKEYIVKKELVNAWEKDIKKKKENTLLLRIINGRHNMKNSYNRR